MRSCQARSQLFSELNDPEPGLLRRQSSFLLHKETLTVGPLDRLFWEGGVSQRAGTLTLEDRLIFHVLNGSETRRGNRGKPQGVHRCVPYLVEAVPANHHNWGSEAGPSRSTRIDCCSKRLWRPHPLRPNFGRLLIESPWHAPLASGIFEAPESRARFRSFRSWLWIRVMPRTFDWGRHGAVYTTLSRRETWTESPSHRCNTHDVLCTRDRTQEFPDLPLGLPHHAAGMRGR
jgi:hypothetical protein